MINTAIRKKMALASSTALAIAFIAFIPSAAADMVPTSKASIAGSTVSITAYSVTSRAASITCSLTVDDPHLSNHVPGTINVVARVECSAPVPRIEGIVSLGRNGVVVSQNGPTFSAGSASWRINTATLCVGGNYQGGSVVDIYFPPGYEPPTARGSAFSNIRSIVC